MQSIFAVTSNVQQWRRRYPRIFLLLVFAFVFLPIYVPLLLGIDLYVAGDTMGFNYPPLKALRGFSIRSLLADPYSGRGFPWIATYGTLDPIAHILRLVFDEYVTLAWLCYIYIVLGAWLFSLYLRRLGRSDVAAFIGALLYVGAFFWVADGDYPLASSLPLFAGLLLGSTLLRMHPIRAFAMLSFTIAYAWVGGHFNFVPLMITAVAVMTVINGFLHTGSWLARGKPFIIFCCATFLGTAIGLVKLIPAFANIAFSERAGGLSVESAGRASIPLSALYTAVFPYLTIPFMSGELGLFFFGATGLLLLIVGLLQRNRLARLAIWGMAFCILIALPHSPLYAFIQSLPFFSFLRAPRRWLLVAYACLGVITAVAADDVLMGKLRYVRGTSKVLLSIGITAAIGSVVVTLVDIFAGVSIIATAQNYFDAHIYAQTSGLPIEHYHRHIAQLWTQSVEHASLFSPRFVVPLIGLLITGWVMLRIFPRTQQKSFLLAALSVASLIPSFFFYHPRSSYVEFEESKRIWSTANLGDAYVLPLFPGIADQAVRTGVVGEVAEERVRYQIGLLVPNTQAIAEVRGIDFYQPIQPRRMGRLLAALGSNAAPAPVTEKLALASIPLEEKIDVFMRRLPLMQRLGVQYVASVWDLPTPLTLAHSLSFVERLPDIKLYKLPDTQPLAYMSSYIRVQNVDEDAAIAYLRDAESVDPTLIECTSCMYGERAQIPGRVEVTEHFDTSIDIEVDTEVSGYLTVLLPRLPGWRAYVDGTQVNTGIADGMFWAVPVPGGKHSVQLKITYATLFIDSLRMLINKADLQLL